MCGAPGRPHRLGATSPCWCASGPSWPVVRSQATGLYCAPSVCDGRLPYNDRFPCYGCWLCCVRPEARGGKGFVGQLSDQVDVAPHPCGRNHGISIADGRQYRIVRVVNLVFSILKTVEIDRDEQLPAGGKHRPFETRAPCRPSDTSVDVDVGAEERGPILRSALTGYGTFHKFKIFVGPSPRQPKRLIESLRSSGTRKYRRAHPRVGASTGSNNGPTRRHR